MMKVQHLCKITVGLQDYYLLTTELINDKQCEGFQLALCDGKSAWCGTVTVNALEAYSKKIHMDYDEMLAQTRKALSKDKMGNMIFVYEVKATGKHDVQFIWKQHVTAENIKFQLGTVDLRQSSTPSDVLCQIFEHAIDSTSVLEEKITHLQSDNERLISERAAAIKRLEKHINAKVDIENDLYSKFVVVLNDKKAKIRELRQRATGGDRGSPRPTNQSGDETDGDVSDHSERETPVKREYDSEYNTDEDEKPSNAPAKKQRGVKESLNSSGEASLLLDDGGDDDHNVHAPVARRQRGGAASGRKQTPSKPVIPKVSSSETKANPGTSRGSRKSSIKKNPSLNSSKSENMDDLMDSF